MPDEKTETVTTESTTEVSGDNQGTEKPYQQPGLAQLFSSAQSGEDFGANDTGIQTAEDQGEEAGTTEQATEESTTTEEKETKETQGSEEATTEETTEEKTETTQTDKTTYPVGMVPISVVQAERKKRQALEKQLREATEGEYTESDDTERTQTQGQGQALSESDFITSLRFANLEYGKEEFEKRNQAVQEAIEKDPGIMDQLLAQPDPGRFIYNLGERILLTKKYGTSDPTQLVNRIKEETVKEVEEQTRQRLMKEFNQKVEQRNQTPTNISTARARSGETEQPYQSPPIGSLMKSIKEKAQRKYYGQRAKA